MISVQLKRQFPALTIDVRTEFAERMTVVAGQSGSGKSTILKMIAGFADPEEGYVQVSGQYVYNRSKNINVYPEKRKIGYVPQNYLLFPHMSVFDNIAFGLQQQKMAKKEIARQVEQAMELCGIRHLHNRFPRDLSGGEKQRVALSRAIVTQPALLLLDEPFSALDVQTKRYVRTEIMEILSAASIPAIMVTHDPMDAITFGKQVYIMERGKLVQQGAYDELRKRPRTSFVAEFAGLTAYKGVAFPDRSGLLRIRLHEGTELKAVGQTTGDVLAIFDPTDIVIAREEEGMQLSTRNCFVMKIMEMHRLVNGMYRLHLKDNLELQAAVSAEAMEQLKLKIGDRVYASIKAAAIRIEPLNSF
ncbi:molybdenum ABC transporter ATP-binding protein [Xylanibacillus composti]|uniref:Carnitine transport ATP-binding protein OpuCA n=1 Tax=Xylanibacillus composti TaxID=1572762 RepID=A0A8J4H2A6_9BACL|nr:ABC transporter ATP-binding protein [Xylanibacillus composti]GIQ69647.1 molybdenum ABC transporter ATP-binding protein [Xylanibacillus composti]